MNYDRKALKLEAKALIRETRPKVWMVTLVFVLLAFVLPELIEGVFNPVWNLLPQFYDTMADGIATGREPDELWVISILGQAIGGGMMVLFLSVLFSLLSTVLTYGYKGYAIRVFLRQKAGPGTVFSAFPQAGRVIGTEIMCAIFIFLWTLLIQAVAGLALGLVAGILGGVLGLGWLAGLCSVVMWVAAFVLNLLVCLRYCLAPYFVMHQDRGVFESITASKETMRGQYGKKLVLDLSFLGWGALVVLIIYIVALVGMVVVLLTAGLPWMMELEEASHYMMTEQEEVVFLIRSMADLLRGITVPAVVVAVLAWLAALPLNLWLQAYQTVAEAGFFLTVTGQVFLVHDESEVPAPMASVPVESAQELPWSPETDQSPETPQPPVEPPVPVEPDPPSEPEEVSAEPGLPAEPEPPETTEE